MTKNKQNVTAVELFPKLYNIEQGINQHHPEFHPDSLQYARYWEEQEKYCIEGKWIDDSADGKGGWRWMPGNLYYYINFCVIEDEDEKGNSVAIIHPLLRDVDWLLAYGWLTCRGFSGFEDDDEYTCHRVINKLEKGKELTPKEKWVVDHLENVHKPDGTYKKYIEAREYLYKTHNKPLGRALFGNTALNFFVLGSRGFGKSFFLANAIIGHEYNFYGKKRFDDQYLYNPSPVEIFVGAALASKSSDLLKKFTKSQERLKKDYGAWGKNEDFIPGYFFNNSTGSLMPNNAHSPYRHEYKYKEGGVWVTGGTGTRLMHGVYTSENPQAAVGTRPTVMAIEEVGLVGNLLEVHGANETCQIRKTKFGSSIYIGTAGNMEKIEQSKIIFEDPEAFNMLGYGDHWEHRSKNIGFFIPAYYVDNSFKDEQGNTNLQAALDEELYQRGEKEKAANSSALDQYMMSRPLVPSEMFLSPTANVFPTAKLRQRLAHVETTDLFTRRASIGDLTWADSDQRTVRWTEDLTPRRRHRVIDKMNLDSYKQGLNGAVVVYEHPQEGVSNPTYRKSLYKIVYDPVKDDGEGTSLASILVYKGFADNAWNNGIQDGIVAEWIGRYDQVYAIHDLCLKLAYYYNALILVENNLPGFIRYCKTKKHVQKLMINPAEAVAKGVQNPSNKYEWGVTMSKQLAVHCEQLIRQWLLEHWKVIHDENHEVKDILLNIDKLTSLRLLQEFISYDRDGNFDHISSFKLLVLWLSQERENTVHKEQLDDFDPYKELNDFAVSTISTYKRPKVNPWFN